MQTISITKTIRFPISSANTNNVFVLTPVNATVLNPGQRILSRNRFIKNLKAYSNIQSVAEAEIPNFLFEDSETDKLNKVLDIEWKSARKQLSLLLGTTNDWMTIGETSLLNPMGYPYRIHNLMDILTDNLAFEVGNDLELALRIDDVGHGKLAGADKVNIFGTYIEEIVIDESVQPITTKREDTFFIDGTYNAIISSNNNRKYCLIQNNGNNPIYISFSNYADATNIKILPNGHFDFDIKTVPYYGVISCFCEYNSSVLIMECS